MGVLGEIQIPYSSWYTETGHIKIDTQLQIMQDDNFVIVGNKIYVPDHVCIEGDVRIVKIIETSYQHKGSGIHEMVYIERFCLVDGHGKREEYLPLMMKIYRQNKPKCDIYYMTENIETGICGITGDQQHMQYLPSFYLDIFVKRHVPNILTGNGIYTPDLAIPCDFDTLEYHKCTKTLETVIREIENIRRKHRFQYPSDDLTREYVSSSFEKRRLNRDRVTNRHVCIETASCDEILQKEINFKIAKNELSSKEYTEHYELAKMMFESIITDLYVDYYVDYEAIQEDGCANGGYEMKYICARYNPELSVAVANRFINEIYITLMNTKYVWDNERVHNIRVIKTYTDILVVSLYDAKEKLLDQDVIDLSLVAVNNDSFIF